MAGLMCRVMMIVVQVKIDRSAVHQTVHAPIGCSKDAPGGASRNWVCTSPVCYFVVIIDE
jgi:hypothetical protein